MRARLHGGDIADFEADEARDADVLAELGNLGFHQLADTQGSFLYEWLLQQANLFVKFL